MTKYDCGAAKQEWDLAQLNVGAQQLRRGVAYPNTVLKVCVIWDLAYLRNRGDNLEGNIEEEKNVYNVSE